MVFLAGCAGAPRWGSWSKAPSPEHLAAAANRPAAPVLYVAGAYGTPR